MNDLADFTKGDPQDADGPFGPMTGVTPEPAKPTPRLLVAGGAVVGLLAVIAAGVGVRWWIKRNLDRLPRRLLTLVLWGAKRMASQQA